MEKATQRPPIVTILGHVDHGKTTLLDTIRKTSVAAREVGGITQKIGAYTVVTESGQKITFIDTPGHEAFKQMRGRGAKVADVAVLVVAANEGAKPQTRESISLIHQAGIPMIVAITKTDLGSANVPQVKSELATLGISLEDQGGDVPVVPLSAKTGEGIPDLLEVISLVAQLHGLEGRPEDRMRAFVIESRQDAGRGPVATVVVTAGTLSVGDEVRAGNVSGKVKAISGAWPSGLTGDKGENIRQILPGMAGEVLGFNTPPPVGEGVVSGGAVEEREEGKETSQGTVVDGSKRLTILVKADSFGSLEALLNALPEDIGILSAGVGDVNQNDIMLASSFNVPIVGFNVKILPQVSDLVQKEGTTIKLFSLIYEAIEFITKPGEVTRPVSKVLGKAEIRAQFPFGKFDRIAGVVVSEGRIAKGDRLRVLRGGEVIGEARIKSLQQRTSAAGSVPKGGECGVIFREKVDFKIGDVIESIR